MDGAQIRYLKMLIFITVTFTSRNMKSLGIFIENKRYKEEYYSIT